MTTEALDFGHRRRRRRGAPRWTGPVLAGLAVIAVVLVILLQGPTIGERRTERRVINVVLPPPPPPPPPPKERPPEPEKPKFVDKPITQAKPPPPTPEPTPEANDALTAREGTAGNSFGLASGDGSGTRIGGKPGGDAFAAYASVVLADVRQAVQTDAKLSRGRYTVRFTVWVTPEGAIREVRLEESSGDADRDAALQSLLTKLVLSQRPPAGLPSVRLELNSRPSF